MIQNSTKSLDTRQLFHDFNERYTAYNFCSYVDHFCHASFSFSLRKIISLFSCESIAPMPTPQASHSTSNTLSKFEKVKIRALVSFILTSSKALPASSVQLKTPFFFKRSVRCYQATKFTNETSVKSSQVVKASYLSSTLGCGPISSCPHFLLVYIDLQ